jgi:hypothetical protein
MKISILNRFLAVFLISFAIISCKKNSDDKVDFATESSVQTEDQNNVASENDNLANDINAVVDNYGVLTGRTNNLFPPPCDATITVDSISTPKKVTITFNGSTCNPLRKRTGTIVVTMPTQGRWRDAGAEITVSIQNVKITRTRDNKSIVINGTQLIKNISGGLIRNLATLNTITHTITSNNMSITFDNNTQRNWNIAKRRVFTYNNGIVITTTGTATIDGISGTAEWGTNRFGNAFITAITQPLVVRQDCNFRLTAGQVTHNKLAATLTVTFGLDANGNVTTCPGLGLYYMKLVYVTNNVTRTVIIPY